MGIREDNLARYKVPREVIFLDELPRTPTGQLLKGAISARALKMTR